MKQGASFLLTTILAALMAGVGIPSTASAETVLKTGGSGFGLGVMEILAEAYKKSHPGVRIIIVPSLGSSGGIKALLNGSLDFAVSGRPLKEDEKSRGGNAMELARTPFVFIVNGKVNKHDITTRELENIYSGRMAAWPGGALLRLVLRPKTESDTAIIKGISPAMEQALESAQAREGMIMAITDQDSASAVDRVAGALGGGALTQVLTEKRPVRILSLNGVRPSIKGIRDGSYPLAKTLYLVTSQKTPEAARQFIAFIGSKTGREILSKYGNLAAEAR